MAEQTGIQWCDATFNPWVGCEKVSPGCAHCYAETLVQGRMGRAGAWGADGQRQRTSPANWRKPELWARLARDGRLPDGRENLDGHRPRVFCASLADVFEDGPELDPWRLDLFALIAETPELDWLVLTKRPEVAHDWLGDISRDAIEQLWDTSPAIAAVLDDIAWPLPNVWLGVSIENARWTKRADVLRQIPAAVRFISAEPLLGSLYDAPEVRCPKCLHGSYAHGPDGCDVEVSDVGACDCGCEKEFPKPLDLSGIDWVIVGGESGPGARPFRLEWAREIIAAAQAVQRYGSAHDEWRGHPGPEVFVKQLGAKPVEGHTTQHYLKLRDRKGGDWDEWPADLRIREFPRSAA